MSKLLKCRVEGCNAEFEDYNQGRICKVCRRINYNAYLKKKKLEKEALGLADEHRQPYPYTPKEAMNRFTTIRKELRACGSRKNWKDYLKNKLDELFEHKELMTWIFQRHGESLDKLIIGDEEVVDTKPKTLGRPTNDISKRTISNADAWQKIENDIDKLSTKKL